MEKQNITKNVYYECFSSRWILKLQNTYKAPYIKKQSNITKKKKKTCIINVFPHVRYQNAKMHTKYSIWKSTTLPKSVLWEFLRLRFFEILKTLSACKVLIWKKKKKILPKNVSFEFFSFLHTKTLKRM